MGSSCSHVPLHQGMAHRMRLLLVIVRQLSLAAAHRHMTESSNLADLQDWDYHSTSCSGLRMLATVRSQVPALSDLCCLHRSFSGCVSLYRNLQVRELRRLVPLQELKQHSSGELEGMVLLSKGRLSVQPVTKQQWDFILHLAEEEPKEAS